MALPEPFSRGTFIFDLADPAQERQLIQLLRNRHVLRAAFNRIWDVVSKQGCEGSRICRSVVLEAEYVDRDYAEGYGQLYGRAFRHFERLCYRLHFFSAPMQPQDLHIPSVSSAEGQQARQKLQNCYLGFAVIRPSCPDTVGRTVILPFCIDVGPKDINFIQYSIKYYRSIISYFSNTFNNRAVYYHGERMARTWRADN